MVVGVGILLIRPPERDCIQVSSLFRQNSRHHFFDVMARTSVSRELGPKFVVALLIFSNTDMHRPPPAHEENSEQRCRWWVILLRHLLYKRILVLRERAGTTILVETMRMAETGDEDRQNCCGPGISIHPKLTTPEDL